MTRCQPDTAKVLSPAGMMADQVEIVDFGATGEALALRAILEHLGLRVGLSLIGNPNDFPGALSSPCGTLILCGHGDRRGFLLGPYGNGVDTRMMTGDALPPKALSGVRIIAPTVLSTACETGSRRFADAMLNAGAGAYAAPTGFIDGRVPLLTLHRAFHAHVMRAVPLDSAIETAQEDLPDDDRFAWFCR